MHDLLIHHHADALSDHPLALHANQAQVCGTRVGDHNKAASSPKALSGPQELLLVSGEVDAGKVVLTPLKALYGEPSLMEDGPYLLRIVTANGVVDHRFAMRPLDHLTTPQHFSFTIAHPGKIFSMTILEGGRTLLRTEATAVTMGRPPQKAQQVTPAVTFTEQGGQLRLNWDSSKYRYLTVTHVGERRSTLAQDLQGGQASLPMEDLPTGGRYEFSLSDGLNTLRLERVR